MLRIPRRYLYDRVISAPLRAHVAERTTRRANGNMDVVPVSSGESDTPDARLESDEMLALAAELFTRVKPSLERVLARRAADRAQIDAAMRDATQFNRHLALEHDVAHPLYRTALGATDRDAPNRVLFGAHVGSAATFNVASQGGRRVAALPPHLQGAHVTLFGPADSARMAVNAMNAFHRRLPGEPATLAPYVAEDRVAPPRWGADNEDSKTPLRMSLLTSMHNLMQCYDGSLPGLERRAPLSTPVKRIPGLALPSVAHFVGADPLPLHVLDLALHMHYMWDKPSALAFYFPKLETDEEAAYLAELFRTCEELVQARHATYRVGTVRVLIVLENPRALFRINEIIDALHPYFAGASLGWHDYLASTARLFKEDPAYRIPAKSDPNIVLRHIKESHVLLAKVVSARGGVAIGGMYGVLPFGRDLADVSMVETLVGYIKDVVTQLRRGLDGFWVAHPDFVRIGIALVNAHHGMPPRADATPAEREAGRVERLSAVAAALVPSRADELRRFIAAPDPTPSLDRSDPAYARAVLAAELGEVAGLANNKPDEMRYNVLQMLQYLAAWLSGNGCVALPATIRGTRVRVMDDLATTERSRWQVFLELYHGRFELDEFLAIVDDELRRIRSGTGEDVHVKWSAETAKWYPVARRLLVRLMTDRDPTEFATELLMAFTVDSVRTAADPWAAAVAIDALKFRYSPYAEAFERRLAERLGDVAAERAATYSAATPADVTAAVAAARAPPCAASLNLDALLAKRGGGAVHGASVATLWPRGGHGDAEVSLVRERGRGDIAIDAFRGGRVASPNTVLQHASLSKPIGTAFALEFFAERGLSLETSVNEVLQRAGSPFRLEAAAGGDAAWADQVQLQHLVSHTGGLGQHYVYGTEVTATSGAVPTPLTLLRGEAPGYSPVRVARAPDTEFAYSGAGFVLLQHVLEQLAGGKQHISALMAPWLARCGLADDIAVPDAYGRVAARFDYAAGVDRAGKPYAQLAFPPLAAGMVCTPRGMAAFLRHLVRAFGDKAGSGGISHETAVRMLHARRQAARSREFMGVDVGLGIFVAECGPNRLAVHQAANEGYRGVFAVVFAGPDAGKGFVSVALGDDDAVTFNSAVGREVLASMGIAGARFDKLAPLGAIVGATSRETVVNQGYRQQLFAAFTPDLPELQEAPSDAAQHPQATADALGGASVVSTSNERFGRASNLVLAREPIFDPDAFGRHGKIMDSWESVRHNPLPFDTAVYRLRDGAPAAALDLVEVSTLFHDGNHTPQVAIDVSESSDVADAKWVELLPKEALEGHTLHRFKVPARRAADRFRLVRVRGYPDGGLTRVHLFNSATVPVAFAGSFPSRVRDSRPILPPSQLRGGAAHAAAGAATTSASSVEQHWQVALKRVARRDVNVACEVFGATVEEASNEHYGKAVHIVSWRDPRGMWDGFESKRARAPNHSEWVRVRLGRPTRVERIELDFTYFVNNNPARVAVHGQSADGAWHELLPSTAVKAFAGNVGVWRSSNAKVLVHTVRVTCAPCGGFNRLGIFGTD
jgi:malate synthase